MNLKLAVLHVWLAAAICVCGHRLTTFVMKSFGGAQPFVFIDPIHITMAKSWLASLQQPNGCITSVGKLFHNDMQVKAEGAD